MSEHSEQCALFDFARVFGGRVPELDLLFAIPNGGKRDKAIAAQLQRSGVRAGVPDMFLPVPREGKAGLWIELKDGKGRTSAFQDRWLSDLRAQGYACHVCYGWVEAAKVIVRYLGRDPKEFGLESAVGAT